MSKRFTLLLLLLALLAAVITACGRSDPEATPIPFTPTFMPTPAAPIVIHIVSDRPGVPGQMPAGGVALPPSGFNQPNGIAVPPTPAVPDSASDMLSDLSTSQITDNSPAASTVHPTAVATQIATAVTASEAEMSVAAQPESVIQSQPGAAQTGPGGQAPDLASAAAELGVTEDALLAAFGGPQAGGPPAGSPPSN